MLGWMRYCWCMSKDARCRARLYYRRYGRDFSIDYHELLQNPRAVVTLLPQLVVLMKPVSTVRLEDCLELAASPPDADAWYVHLLVGDFDCARVLAAQLEPLPMLCFQRGGRNADFHICDWARFTKV